MSRMCHGQFVGIIPSVDSLAVAAEKNETTFTYDLYQVQTPVPQLSKGLAFDEQSDVCKMWLEVRHHQMLLFVQMLSFNRGLKTTQCNINRPSGYRNLFSIWERCGISAQNRKCGFIDSLEVPQMLNLRVFFLLQQLIYFSSQVAVIKKCKISPNLTVVRPRTFL